MSWSEALDMNPNAPKAGGIRYEYDNAGWPRDFDIRIEVAEQREVLMASLANRTSMRKTVSDTSTLAAPGGLTNIRNDR